MEKIREFILLLLFCLFERVKCRRVTQRTRNADPNRRNKDLGEKAGVGWGRGGVGGGGGKGVVVGGRRT